MAKVKELLDRLENELLAEADAVVSTKSEEIKAKAQEAYNAAFNAEVSNIKATVEVKYATARNYLNELLEESGE